MQWKKAGRYTATSRSAGRVETYAKADVRVDIIEVPDGENARDAMHYEKAYAIQTDPDNIAPVRPERIRL